MHIRTFANPTVGTVEGQRIRRARAQALWQRSGLPRFVKRYLRETFSLADRDANRKGGRP